MIIMDCFIENKMVMYRTIYCLKKTHIDLVKVENGLLMPEMNKYPFLLLALLGGLQLSPHKPQGTNIPHPPTPHLLRKPEEHRNRMRRQHLGLPSGNRSDDDGEEDEKENRQPKDNDFLDSLVSQLLKKWGEAIDQLLDQVTADLKDFKLRLGIPQ
uniref:E4 protein n=1 Tax=Human papillomavirus TaxID=10566 RepID=H2BQC5_9PAPI|nr:E4 protein [Human papillomavirus]